MDNSHTKYPFVRDTQGLILQEAMLRVVLLKVEQLSVKTSVRLYQWHLRQSKKKSNAGLPLEILDRSHEAFVSVDPTLSKLQDDVVAQLSSIGLDPKEEVLMDSGYRLDAIVGDCASLFASCLLLAIANPLTNYLWSSG